MAGKVGSPGLPVRITRDFEFIFSIGEGSFGKVWKARNQTDKCYYALKEICIAKALLKIGNNLNGLFEEVHVLQLLNHPNIVRYHTSWLEGPKSEEIKNGSLSFAEDMSSTDTNLLLIQMELCESTLKCVLRNSVFNLEIPPLFCQLSEALHFIHDHNIIHRDIKPDNIFLSGNLWKIGDFGLARLFTDNSTLSTAGCSAYQSPDPGCSKKSDVFTLGLVFLEVLHAISTKAVGTFPTVKYKEILRAIQPSFRQECAIISKMLRQDKDERVSSGQVKWEFSGLYDYRKMPDFIVNVNPGNNIPDGVSGDYSNETGTGEEALFNEIEIQAPTTPQSNINEENNITQQLTKTQGEQVNQLLALLQSTSRQEDSVIPSEKSFLEFPNPVTNFTGRSSLMDDVIKSLTSWSTNLKHQINFPLVNLYGLGGHGKTQTAQAVAVTCIEDEHFDAEIWIDAEKEEEIMQKMTLELKNQCIEKIPENEGILLANKFYNLISSKGSQKILVIFDNVEGFYEVQNFLPLNKNMENVAILLTSVEMVTISSEKGKSDNYRVDVLEEDEAKELFTTILKDSVDYTESDLSLLVEESGKIPIIICMMAGTIASGGSKSSITQLIRRWKEFSDKILRYPKTPKRSKTEKEKKKKSSDEYEKSLYVCVKIALEYLKQSTDKYASVALHIIEKCAYFHNNCPLKYILEHVTTIKQDIEEVISEELLLPLEPDQVLKNAIELLSRFSLISFRTINYSKIEMKAEIHRLVHGTLILIQKDENREETILEDLIGCEDYPELSGSITCAVIWSHAANHDRLIRKYFMEKGSFKGLVQHGFLNEVKKIIKTLGESDSASRILQPERIGYKKINGLESALENDFKGLGREFVRLLKTNRTHICDDVWNTGIKTTLIFCLQRLNLEVFTYLVDELALDVNFLSSSRGMYRTDNLLVISSASGKLDVATYLLSKNVDPFIKGDHGNSALHALATVWEEKQEVIFLASQIVSTYPALLYGKNIDGELAFMTAAKFGCPNYLNSLLDNMEDASEQINCTDNKGNTAVMLAIENCQQRPMSEVIAVLVKYGANIHYVNTMKLWNAWHYATRSAFGFTKPKDFRLYFVLKTLVRHNVDPEFQDGNGDTFFHAIMKRCTFESIDENTVIDILEFIVANNMCKIFDCENGDGLSVMKLAEKLKDPPSKCSEDETSSISSDEESLHEGLIENLDIVIGFIRRLKGNHLNLESTLCERIETQNPPNIQKTTIIETNAFLPFPKPYKNFAGRTRLCDDVIKYLTSQVLNSVAQIRVPLVNLYGPSGYGKTQIALKIAERCSMEALFSDIIWIDADNESRIKEKVWRELHNQGIPNIQGNRGIFLINKLYDLIESRNPNKVLVIFDDIDGFDEIKNYLPLNRNVNLVILLISENEVVFPPEYEEICTFEVDIFDEDDAKELVAKQLNGSPDYKENEISLLLSESGRIPIILSIMTGIIATVGRKYSMSKILHEIEAEKQSKIPRCSKNRNTQDDFSSQCDELMYVCMKIVIKKLEESTNEYAVMAIKFLERCGYFNNICSLKFILDKVPSIMQDSEKISDESPFPIEPKQMLIRSVKLMSKFSLVDYVAGDDPYVIIHPRVQSSIRHIQQEEQREHDILKELISFLSPLYGHML
ncbi:uncharacterized protein LOC118433670 isoform X3 [Folsomia candida]|uniref:uncharacterized protein LOC118433670 isoform X3 n=1 Tax=Folsomia candida TaxID=158441 RepID=UPI0016053936|nr:uncharacterized protein LOC118433670 isoform X3 [Folsomia candida]